MPQEKKNPIWGWVKVFVLYACLLVMLYVFTWKYVNPQLQGYFKSHIVWIVFQCIGLFITLFGLKNIVFHEILFRSGERLKSQERKVRKESLDFDAVRKDV